MNIRFKLLEVRYASYEQGIPENDWAFASIQDTSKTIRQLIDETIKEVQTDVNEHAEFDQAYGFWYEAGGRDYYVTYADNYQSGCELRCRSMGKTVLATYLDEEGVLNRTLEDAIKIHKKIIKQYSAHLEPQEA